MKHFALLAAFIVLPVIFGPKMVVGQSPSAFSPYVDAEGTISMPSDFREWAYLGTWSIAGDDEAGGPLVFTSSTHNLKPSRPIGAPGNSRMARCS